MSNYMTDVKPSTAGFKEENKDAICTAIREAAMDKEWNSYGWVDVYRNAEKLEDQLDEFGITLREENNLLFFEFNDVYESAFFETMMKKIAPYMEDGVILVDNEYGIMAYTFENGKEKTCYGDDAFEAYSRSYFGQFIEDRTDEGFGFEIEG